MNRAAQPPVLDAVTTSAGMSKATAPPAVTNGTRTRSASSSKRLNCSSSNSPPNVQTHALSVEISDSIEAKRTVPLMPLHLGTL